MFVIARQKKAELRSVLDPTTKKHVGEILYYVHRSILTEYFDAEILIQRVKRLQPEEIAFKIRSFDHELCTEVFLAELKTVLPTPEQV